MLRKLHFWAPKPRLLDRFIFSHLDNKYFSLFKLRQESPAKMRTLPSPLPPGGMVLHSIWCKTDLCKRLDRCIRQGQDRSRGSAAALFAARLQQALPSDPTHSEALAVG